MQRWSFWDDYSHQNNARALSALRILGLFLQADVTGIFPRAATVPPGLLGRASSACAHSTECAYGSSNTIAKSSSRVNNKNKSSFLSTSPMKADTTHVEFECFLILGPFVKETEIMSAATGHKICLIIRQRRRGGFYKVNKIGSRGRPTH